MSRTAAALWDLGILPCDDAPVDPVLSDLTAQAQAWLFALSGRRVGEFVTLEDRYRPSTSSECGGPYKDADGIWRNGSTGGDDCCRIELDRQPVRSVTEVRVNGVALDPGSYHLEGNTLIRDGACWPLAEPCDPAPVEVDYLWGIPADVTALAAARELVCEMNRAITGRECSLPGGAQQIVRQGVTITRPDLETLLGNGLTGMPLVDTFVRVYNPSRLQQRSRMYSPDRAARVG
jgi:hypothetical protein